MKSELLEELKENLSKVDKETLAREIDDLGVEVKSGNFMFDSLVGRSADTFSYDDSLFFPETEYESVLCNNEAA